MSFLRSTLAGKVGRRVKFGTDGWVDPLDIEGFQMCCFALRPLARNLFDLVLPLAIHFKIHHFCEEPDAVLTAVLHVDYQRLFAGPSGAHVGKGVLAEIEMDPNLPVPETARGRVSHRPPGHVRPSRRARPRFVCRRSRVTAHRQPQTTPYDPRRRAHPRRRPHPAPSGPGGHNGQAVEGAQGPSGASGAGRLRSSGPTPLTQPVPRAPLRLPISPLSLTLAHWYTYLCDHYRLRAHG